jgi:hypothetical protein
MKAILQIVMTVAYIALGFTQFFAEIDGLHDVLGWPKLVCWIVSAVTAWIPLVGTAAGIWGAHAAWAWDWLPAVGLFLGLPIGVLCLVAVAGAFDAAKRKMEARRAP